ncbi:jg17831 [Pararge aegeria aegeria]|uniref:Jg17831 protein n=1 Tax=Pararge aegeria aegeria TaxID=348720 RepID=A0A8S4SLH0_9NEOP|nr:jg17831 [Pararge aegeria aegeria]
MKDLLAPSSLVTWKPLHAYHQVVQPPLPRELLQSPLPARQRGGTNGDIDDSRPIGINNIPTRADDDFADSDADISRTRQTNRPKANDGGP